MIIITTIITINAYHYTADSAFYNCPFTCINNWNPTTVRTYGTNALTIAQKTTTCVCASGSYNDNYICTPCEVGYYCTGGIKLACSTGYTTLSTGSTSINQCLYLCTSPDANCCRDRVLIATSVLYIGIL